MRYFYAILPSVVFLLGIWYWLRHRVPHVRGTKCVGDFRNDTEGVLSLADLQWAWTRAQLMVANGNWVINALDAINPYVKPVLHPGDKRAWDLKPECLGVRGTHGSPYRGASGVTDNGHNIAIDIDLTHIMVRNYASYEMENCIGIRLGFPMRNR